MLWDFRGAAGTWNYRREPDHMVPIPGRTGVKNLLAVALVAAAATASLVTPAQAHTLCDNGDGGEVGVWTGPDGPGAGADVDETNGIYLCVDTGLTGGDYQVVVIRLGDPEICLFYPSNPCL